MYDVYVGYPCNQCEYAADYTTLHIHTGPRDTKHGETSFKIKFRCPTFQDIEMFNER